MKKIKGSNSVFLLYFRSISRLRWDWTNFIIPPALSLLISIILNVSLVPFDKLVKSQINFVEACLSFNGAILGFIISAYAIFASVGDRDLIIFGITNKRDGDYYSFHKTKLLTFFKSFFWLFTACVTSFGYLLVLIFLKKFELLNFSFELKNLFLANLLFFYCQFKVFIELKVLIFTIYNSSLTQAKFMAQADKLTPIDESND